MKWVIGDPVINRLSNEKGVVVDVNNYWGWYVVEYSEGVKKRYTTDLRDNDLICKPDPNRVKSES
jgi:hypothetical protein